MLKAQDIMTRRVSTISQDMAADAAGEFLSSKGIPSVPVVTDTGPKQKLIGFLSEADLLQFCANQAYFHHQDVKVGQLMRRHPYCIGEDVDIFEIARIFMDTKYRVLPVIDREGFLLGIVRRKVVLKSLLDSIRDEDADTLAKMRDKDLHQIVNHRFIVG